MKQNIRTLLSLAAMTFALLLSSCTPKEEFKAGDKVDGAQVYFPAETVTEYSIGEDVTSIDITVKRLVKEGALSVPVLVDASALEEAEADAFFTFPEKVEFKDGEDNAKFTVSFERSELVDGEEYNFSLLLNDEKNITPYGNRTLNLTVSPWPWELLGEGKFRDDWLTAMFGGSPVEVDVTIHENKTQKGVYMIEQMFGWNFLTTFFDGSQADIESQLLTYVPTDIVINCSNPEQVYIGGQFSGIVDNDPDYGKYLIGTSPAVYGTLKDGVITFPVEGLILQCDKGGMYANKSGMFRILLPGAEVIDYAIAAEYDGMKVNADGSVASAVVNFAYGADVTGVSYAFAKGDITADPSDFIKSVVDGTAENVYVVGNFVPGAGSASIEAELETGSYTVVAFAKDKDGKLTAENTAAAWFYFPGLGGSSVPECDLEVALFHTSEFNPAHLENFPDHSSLFYQLSGSGIKSIKMYLNKTAVIENAVSQGMSHEYLLTNYGQDMPQTIIDRINTAGSYASVYYNLDPETSWTLLVLAGNEYGKTVLKTAVKSTAQAPYSGELVIGNYAMTCVHPAETEADEDVVCQTVLKVSPTEGSEELFVVSNLADGDGISWFAKYDSAAKTLTLDGTSPSFGAEYEDENSFAQWLGISQTTALAYFSYSDPEGAADIPLVFTVNDEKQLAGLNVNLQINIGRLSGTSVTSLGVYSLYLAGETSVVYGVPEEESKAAPASVAKTLRKMSKGFIANSPAAKRNVLRSVKTAEIECPAGAVKSATLKVNTSVCEPLAKDTVRRVKAKFTL